MLSDRVKAAYGDGAREEYRLRQIEGIGMAKRSIYGGRWRITGSQLGAGGQSDVFPVEDVTGQLHGEWALKRVRNPNRRQRFISEIAAIKQITHPNIIDVVDHSPIDGEGAGEAQFLVMPIASGGDLSAPERLALYRDNLDSTLAVAKQIAAALGAAHSAGIVHRDVKPQNVLFTGHGHDVWLTDFGICWSQEQQRATEDGEVVGPRAFMAPEMEGGGQLEVSPAADVYALGKMIYYMLSGGTVIPREEVHAPQYRSLLQRGGRYSQLQSLLEQMICSQERRIAGMDEVCRHLDKIEDWDRRAQLVPLGSKGLSAIEKLQQQSRDAQRIGAENEHARGQEASILENITGAFRPWLEAELTKAAALINDSGVLTCELGTLTDRPNEKMVIPAGDEGSYEPLTGFELRLRQVGDRFKHLHHLQIRLLRRGTSLLNIYVGNRPSAAHPVRDFDLAMIPIYLRLHAEQPTQNAFMRGFFTVPSRIAGAQQWRLGRPSKGPIVHPDCFSSVTSGFHNEATQVVRFKASEWITAQEKLGAALTEAIDSFLTFVASGAESIGA